MVPCCGSRAVNTRCELAQERDCLISCAREIVISDLAARAAPCGGTSRAVCVNTRCELQLGPLDAQAQQRDGLISCAERLCHLATVPCGGTSRAVNTRCEQAQQRDSIVSSLESERLRSRIRPRGTLVHTNITHRAPQSPPLPRQLAATPPPRCAARPSATSPRRGASPRSPRCAASGAGSAARPASRTRGAKS